MITDNSNRNVQRYGMVIGVKPDKIKEYKRLHESTWPGVLKKIKECNIINYSIYLKELEPGKFYLFSYFEYTGTDFDADMEKMAADPTTQEWWNVTKPCQIPLSGEESWALTEEVFHTD